MKILPLLSLTLLASSALAAPLGPGPKDLPAPYSEAGLFAPMTARPIAKGHPAWEIMVSLDAKGLPLRAVLASVLESAGLQYAVDPGLDLTIYASVKSVSLRDAVAILGKLADFDVRAENGIWYASRRKPKTPLETTAPRTAILTGPIAGTSKTPPRSGLTVRTTVTATNARPASPRKITMPGEGTTVATQSIYVDTTPRSGAVVPMRVSPPKTISSRTTFPVGATTEETPIPPKKTSAAPKKVISGQVSLGRRVTTKLPKTDLREVFEAFSQQTGVAIVVESDVPRYKIDAYMKGCSLKYALDKICAATGLAYEFHGAAIRIVKA